MCSPPISLDHVHSRPPLQRENSASEDVRQNVYISLSAHRDDEEEEESDETARDMSESYSDHSQSPTSTGQLKNGDLHFKSIDSAEQGSRSSSLSNTVNVSPSSCLLEEDETVYQPQSPFSSPFELNISILKGPQTPVGSQPETPSPLDNKTFLGLRPRKSSSLSNVLDDTSYSTEPPTDTISNTSNPQVHAQHPEHESIINIY